MDKRQIRIVQDKFQSILFSILYHNEIDMSLLTEDAVWCVGSAMHYMYKDEMSNYLVQNDVESTVDRPQITFIVSDYMGDNCISLLGEVRYHGIHHPERQILVNFHTNWVFDGDQWLMKQLISTNKREDEDDGSYSDTRIDARLLMRSIPMGVICCDMNEMMSIQLLNEKALSLVDFDSVARFKQTFGMSLLGAIHPEDIAVLRDYVARLNEGPVEDYVTFRLRKKDFSYIWLQALGMVADDKWLVLACSDYTRHQNQLEAVEKQKTEISELQDSYRSLIDNMPSGFHSCSLSEPVHVDFVSDSLCRMTGYSQYDIHEKMDSIYINMVEPEDHQVIVEAVKSLMQYPHTEQICYRIRKKDGSVIRVWDKMRSVRHEDGKMWGYSIVIELDDDLLLPGQAESKDVSAASSTAVASAAAAVAAVPEPPKPKVEIHTFGYFEVLVNGKPIAFRSAKARELLALLVDRRGNYVSRENIITALWENETVNPVTVTRCRKTYKNLVDELKNYGIEEIVSTENNMRRLVKDKVKCDLFDYLDGDPSAKESFIGAYLTEYSWSEITLSTLLQRFDVQ